MTDEAKNDGSFSEMTGPSQSMVDIWVGPSQCMVDIWVVYFMH